jgi:2-C-methyl-D-erythritol 2,4-cyclodiphosphate synthase
MPELRPGLGFDVHARDDDRDLVLAGVRFDGEPGLAAHSDGDVVCHAVADALLGAAALGDIGRHFPESDPATENMAGLDLLARTVAMLDAAPRSCDVTVIAARPAIEPRRGEMRANLATALGLDASAVSVKATRPEGLGLSGDGVGCLALATIDRP